MVSFTKRALLTDPPFGTWQMLGCITFTSSVSGSDIGGRGPGRRAINVDFLVPDRPILNKLCLKAVAISLWQRAVLWPFYSAINGLEGCGFRLSEVTKDSACATLSWFNKLVRLSAAKISTPSPRVAASPISTGKIGWKKHFTANEAMAKFIQ